MNLFRHAKLLAASSALTLGTLGAIITAASPAHASVASGPINWWSPAHVYLNADRSPGCSVFWVDGQGPAFESIGASTDPYALVTLWKQGPYGPTEVAITTRLVGSSPADPSGAPDVVGEWVVGNPAGPGDYWATIEDATGYFWSSNSLWC